MNRVLIVDDSPDHVHLMEMVAQTAGCLTGAAFNGAQAVELAKASTWDLIFMDIAMPTTDGFEALREIRKFDTVTPIIAVSGMVSPGETEILINSGFSDVIEKPIPLDHIVALLESRSLAVTIPARWSH
jgi:CheY-like chemotaxis protein